MLASASPPSAPNGSGKAALSTVQTSGASDSTQSGLTPSSDLINNTSMQESPLSRDGPFPRFIPSSLRQRRGQGGGEEEVAGKEKKEQRQAAADGRASPPPHKRHLASRLGLVPLHPLLAWIGPTFSSWAKMKPVLRSALIAWIMMLFMVIDVVEIELGNASFLVLVFAFIQPAELPLTGIIEREFFMLLIGLVSWAWACLAIKIADACRTTRVPVAEVSLDLVYDGFYIETAPAIVYGFFLAFGTATWLYLKIRFGPSPFIFASIIGCIALDIILTTAPLFPYPFYDLGTSILKPMAVKSAVTLVVSFLFVPKSVNSLFVDRIVLVLRPLSAALRSQMTQFEQQSPLDDDFEFGKTRSTIGQSERAIPLVAGASRLLLREVSFGIANGQDLSELERLTKGVLATANGFSQYFTAIQSDIQSCHFPPPESRSATRPSSPQPSRAATPLSHQDRSDYLGGDKLHSSAGKEARDDGVQEPSSSRRSSMTDHNRHPHIAAGGSKGQLLHMAPIYSYLHIRGHSPRSQSPSLLHNAVHHHHHTTAPVGTWDSLRFTELEGRLHSRSSDSITAEIFETLGKCSARLMLTNAEAIEHVVRMLEGLNKARYHLLMARLRGRKFTLRDVAERSMADVIADVQEALRCFRQQERVQVIEPFKGAAMRGGAEHGGKVLPHRYLFQAWIHQHTSLVFTERLLLLLHHLDSLETERTRGQFWFPSWPAFHKLDTWRSPEARAEERDSATLHDDEHVGNDDGQDELDAGRPSGPLAGSMGGASRRDPDALEPDGPWQELGARLHAFGHKLVTGNTLFAGKSAMLTGLLSLPFFFRSSAGWVYDNKGVWTLIMSQLTLSRHRGESVFALFGRVVSTVSGAAVGLVVWYISDGARQANPYGLMVVWAVFSVLLMAVRIYYPGPPIVAIIAVITTSLVVGYSWKDQYNPVYGQPGTGWDVAWRRLVEVLLGASAAVIWSFLPPTSTLRQYLRRSHAASIHRSGVLHCRLLAFTSQEIASERNTEDLDEVDPLELSAALISHRQRLRRLDLLSVNVTWETSLRGGWPRERYQQLFEVQLELAKLLSSAVIVSQRLGPAYSKALLRRTRFADADFTADVMSVYSLCSTALRTAQPLPQLSPILFSRYMSDAGFSFDARQTHHDSHEADEEHDLDDLPGLPKILTPEVLESEEYLTFAVGVFTLSAIVLKLDSLLLAVKQLVGESYALPARLFLDGRERTTSDGGSGGGGGVDLKKRRIATHQGRTASP